MRNRLRLFAHWRAFESETVVFDAARNLKSHAFVCTKTWALRLQRGDISLLRAENWKKAAQRRSLSQRTNRPGSTRK
jgi:hypothetical protein